MRNQHQRPLPPMEVQSVSLRRETGAPTEEQEVSLTRLLAESVEETGCSEKDAALSQGYQPNYWSRIKSGEKAAQLERLAKLPEKVQREFIKRYAQELRMHVSDEDARERALKNLVCAAADAMREII